MNKLKFLLPYCVSALIIFLCLLIGKLTTHFSALKLPSAIVGMLLLFALLTKGWIRVKHIQPSSHLLLGYFPLFFIPAGVGVMEHIDLLYTHWFVILCAVLSATIVTLLAVSKCALLLSDKKDA